MPEGDTIFRAARTLDRALRERVVVEFASVFPALTRVHEDRPLTGRTVESVSSAGKHLLMRFSGDLVLRTHMRMSGSWHVYRPGERWQRPRRDMRIVIGTDAYVAVGFTIHDAEFIEGRALEKHADLRALGPDLLSDAFDASEALRRLRARPDAAVTDALLNQRVMAGVGNVYKSEVLFICRVNPSSIVSELTDAQIEKIVETSRTLLRANVSTSLAPMTTYTGYRRTTSRDNPSERLWVYGRARKPCRRCGTPIRVTNRGTNARLTYWCPKCQSRD